MHSVGVTERALGIKDLVAPDIADESVIVAALFHDVGKLDYPGKAVPRPTPWPAAAILRAGAVTTRCGASSS